ncbi:Lipid phosphate phosphatase 2 [Linum perenne]
MLHVECLVVLILIIEKMPEIQLGTHTFKSHGYKVARTYMHDWLILLLLVLIDIVLNMIEPFHRFVGKNMLTDLSFPLKPNTVPVWAVPIIAVLLPLVIILVYYFMRRNVYDLHHAILGLAYSILITGVITDAIKDAVGRPRPNFFWRCFPDGKGVFDPVTTEVICNGVKSVIKEGHKSFPSGHTSCEKLIVLHFHWPFNVYLSQSYCGKKLNCCFMFTGTFAGLGFLALYLTGKVQVFDQRGHVAKLIIMFAPLLLGAMVGISRVDDYWHHWQDVFAGGLIGLVVSSFCYLQFFPPPHSTDGWGPHAYFQMLRESAVGAQPSENTSTALIVRGSELESVYVEQHHGNGGPRSFARDSSLNLDGVESERRR